MLLRCDLTICLMSDSTFIFLLLLPSFLSNDTSYVCAVTSFSLFSDLFSISSRLVFCSLQYFYMQIQVLCSQVRICRRSYLFSQRRCLFSVASLLRRLFISLDLYSLSQRDRCVCCESYLYSVAWSLSSAIMLATSENSSSLRVIFSLASAMSVSRCSFSSFILTQASEQFSFSYIISYNISSFFLAKHLVLPISSAIYCSAYSFTIAVLSIIYCFSLNFSSSLPSFATVSWSSLFFCDNLSSFTDGRCSREVRRWLLNLWLSSMHVLLGYLFCVSLWVFRVSSMTLYVLLQLTFSFMFSFDSASGNLLPLASSSLILLFISSISTCCCVMTLLQL